MLKKCMFCGKDSLIGMSVVRKGLAKKKGGTGSKIVRRTKRRFLPNIQKMRVLINGHPKSIYACTKCIKKGGIIKA